MRICLSMIPLLMLSLGCAGTPPSTIPAAPPAKVHKFPARITAVGVASGINDVSLARSAAESRAVRNLAKTLATDAVRFQFVQHQGDSSLTLTLAAEKVPLLKTSFDKLSRGWVASAVGERSEAVLDAMDQVDGIDAEASLEGETYRQAELGLLLTVAENRALRTALSSQLGTGSDEGKLEGSLTLLDLNETVGELGVRVRLKVHVKAEPVKPLSEEEKRAAHAAVLQEASGLSEWPAAVAALERLAALNPQDPALQLQLADLAMNAQDPKKAIAALEQAFTLDPKQLLPLKRALEIAKGIPDEAKAAELGKRIQEIEHPPKKPAPGKKQPKKAH